MQYDIDNYLNKQTLIAGDVNSGKTFRTKKLIKKFIQAGYEKHIAVIDMAPEPVKKIGGKLSMPNNISVLYLTTQINAPRLMGRDINHICKLAQANADNIEKLFEKFKKQKRDILFINDATLYLQAGNLQNLLEICQLSSTKIINAYYGNTFEDSELTKKERLLTKQLMHYCHSVIIC